VNKIFTIRVIRNASYSEMQNSLTVHQSVCRHYALKFIIPSSVTYEIFIFLPSRCCLCCPLFPQD